jgi:uncharacterized protein (TIGR02217 family)
MAFHDIRFPVNLSFGSIGGPERRTDIVTLSNGFEERNTAWAHSRRRYDAGLGLRSLDDLETVTAFFEARVGQLHGFRWKDWSDYKSCFPSRAPGAEDQLIGTGDGTLQVFQLQKWYRSGLQDYSRPIRKPVYGSVVVALEGDGKIEGEEFTVDFLTGQVTFTLPPEAGTRITAGFEFDVPVRFDTDQIMISVASFNAGEVPKVPVVEVKI